MAVKINRDVRDRVGLLAAICATMLVVHLANLISGGALTVHGIHPRDPASLYAILTAPWLHADLAHLGGNLIGMAIFGGLSLTGGVRHFLIASAIILILSGLGLWLFGRSANHIGASCWIYGLWTLVVVRAVYQRIWRNIAISLIVILLLSGMAAGMMPGDARVSFEGHIFGALSGIVAAWWLYRGRRSAPAAVRVGEAPKFWD